MPNVLASDSSVGFAVLLQEGKESIPLLGGFAMHQMAVLNRQTHIDWVEECSRGRDLVETIGLGLIIQRVKEKKTGTRRITTYRLTSQERQLLAIYIVLCKPSSLFLPPIVPASAPEADKMAPLCYSLA